MIDVTTDSTFDELKESFEQTFDDRNYSPKTRASYSGALTNFISFLVALEIFRIQDVTLEIIEKYQAELLDKYANNTAMNYMKSVKHFFRYLDDYGVIFGNPCLNLSSIKKTQVLPCVPTVKEVENLIESIDTKTFVGIRNRAIIEVFYSAALRREEMLSLTLENIDLNSASLRLKGKGRRERIIPLGSYAVKWIDNYLKAKAEEFSGENNTTESGPLWVTITGGKLGTDPIRKIFREHSALAKLDKALSPHSLRRACATHMLQNGADPLRIQIMLGHADLQTLSHYLRLSITDIKNMHKQTKPGR